MTRIQLRRGTAAEWGAANPVLLQGEVGFETDTGYLRIGDGVTPWSSLAYILTSPALVDNATVPGGSGFQTRVIGQHNVQFKHEQGQAYSTNDPETANLIGVARSVVITEAWNTPGVAKSLWCALSTPNDPGALEDEGFLDFWVDVDESVQSEPSFTLTVSEFFMWVGEAGTFANERVGRTSKGTYDGAGTYTGGGYRLAWIPFQSYIRIEYRNANSSGDAATSYWAAEVTTLPNFSWLGSQQRYFVIAGTRNTAQPAATPLTLVDTTQGGFPSGGGQIESVMVASSSDNWDPIEEGNFQFYVDGEDQPSWESSGGEDFDLGSWGTWPVTSPGYPSGSAPNEPGNSFCWWRFFPDDPITFEQSVRVVWWVGQPGEDTWTDATADARGFVGLWFDNPLTTSPSYKYPDENDADILFFDDFDYPAGTPPSDKFGNSTPGFVCTGSSTVSASVGDANQWLTVLGSYYTPPEEYWIEARVMLNGWVSGTTQEAYLSSHAGGIYGTASIGESVCVELWGDGSAATGLTIAARETYTYMGMELAGTPPAAGLYGQWFEIAQKVVGSMITTYYRLSDDAYWHPMTRWQTQVTGSLIGVASWTANREFDWIRVRPLITAGS